MKNKQPLQRITDFDVVCQEIEEFNKLYCNKLSYGFYSAYKASGKLPDEWYNHLSETKKYLQKHLNIEDALEYKEYKQRYNKNLSFEKYIKDRDIGKLRPKSWYNYLIRCESLIPRDFNAAYTEYVEFIQAFHEDISFYVYYEKKEEGKLPIEWYKFLINLEENISEMLKGSYF